MESISTLTQKGQITLPSSLRRKLNVNPHEKVDFHIEDNKVVSYHVKVRGISNLRASRLAFGKLLPCTAR